MMIKNFEEYILERLHINNDVDKYSSEIYSIMKNSNDSIFIFDNIPLNMNIIKLTIRLENISDMGFLNLDKCKKTKNGWIIEIVLREDFKLSTLEHELFHTLRLTLLEKDKVIRNLNYIRSFNIFNEKEHPEIMDFLEIVYLSNDEEINAKIHEFDGYVKSIIGDQRITKEEFKTLIISSDILNICNLLINFKCDNLFKKYDSNKLNKMFYLLEENKNKLDRYEISKFRKFIYMINRIFSKNYYKPQIVDNRVYMPIKGKSFYDDWISKQGQKLKNRIYSLYDRYI